MLSFTIWLVPIAIFVLLALRLPKGKTTFQDSATQALRIHQDRLQQLQRQHEQREISAEVYQALKLEEERALLADSNYQQRTLHARSLHWLWVPVLSLMIFTTAWLTYGKLGAADALAVQRQFQQLATAEVTPAEISATLRNYEKLLADSQGDLEGWFRLARMQLELAEFGAAIDSFNHVLEQLRGSEHNAEDEATVLAYIGQAYAALGQPDAALEAYAESLNYSQNPAALGMAGKMSFDLGDYRQAIDYWTRLKLLNPEVDASPIDNLIARASNQLAALGIDYQPDITRILVRINLPAAFEGLSARAALFVYARPVGQTMPLAVKRLPVSEQSMTVMLTDADAMGPMGGLSGQDVVEVGARVSLTGVAEPQPGDWLGTATTVNLATATTEVAIAIEQP